MTVDRGAAILALIALSLASALALAEPARVQSGDRGDGHAANHD